MKKINAKVLLTDFGTNTPAADVEKKVGRADLVDHTPQIDSVQHTAADVSKEKSTADDSVEIFTATEKEIADWHSNVSNGFVQNILRPYELDFGSVAIDALKIGLDEKTHSINFVIDDDGHCMRIQLTDNNVEIADENAAEKVFEKIGGIRGKRNKIYTDRIKYQAVRKLL